MGVDIDEVLKEVGEFGPFQRTLYAAMSCGWIPTAVFTLLSVFSNASPTWRCVPQCVVGSGANCTMGLVGNCGSLKHDGSQSFCDLPPHAYEFLDVSHSMVAEFNLTCGDAWQSGFVTSLFFVGFLIGCGVWGHLSDARGRRWCVVPSGLCMVAAAVGMAAAPSLPVYAAARVLSGFGVGGFGLVVYLLANELIGPRYRSATGTMSSAFFSVGEAVLALVAVFVPGWRAQTLVAGATVLPYLLTPCLVPESVRFLVAKGRTREAAEVLKRVARRNGVAVPLQTLDSLEARGRAEADAETEAGDAGADADAGESPDGKAPAKDSATLLDVFRHPALRGRALVMALAWFANSFGYYGLSLDTGNLGGSVILNVVLAAFAEIPGLPIASLGLARIGRRPTIAGLTILSGACCAAGVFLPETPRWHSLRLGFFLVGKMAVAGSFGALYVYASELFPSSVRSAAVGLMSQSARVGGIVAPLAVVLHTVSPRLPFVAFALALIIAGAMSCMLPETRGRRMMETMDDVDASPRGGSPMPRFATARLSGERALLSSDDRSDM